MAPEFKFSVETTLKEGLQDPQATAINQHLNLDEYQSVNVIRVGRYIELLVNTETLDGAEKIVDRLATEFLCNSVIEGYKVTRLEDADE